MTRVVAYGPDAVLVDLPDLAAVRQLDAVLRAEPPAGAVDVVPAARTVLVRFATPRAAADGIAAVRAAVAGRTVPAVPAADVRATPPVVLPVRYDGADLTMVADLTGLTPGEVVRRHTAATYTVAFGGFMPGFAYLTGLDPALHVPRRSSPRPVVPAGSVAVAGEFAAVYPAATPGGWMLLGTCDVPLFDVDRDPPALLRPGTRVRFVVADGPTSGGAPARPAGRSVPPPVPGSGSPAAAALPAGPSSGAASVEVRVPGVLTLVQDRGRPGLAAVGVGRSGAADAGALRLANRLVGNAADAAGLEVLLGGVELRFPSGGVVALAGAEAPAWRDGLPVAPHTATRVPPGGVLRVGDATRGLRVYIAVRGGIAVPPVLGSRAADRLAGIGPAPLRTGDVLPVGSAVQGSAQPWPDPPRTWPRAWLSSWPPAGSSAGSSAGSPAAGQPGPPDLLRTAGAPDGGPRTAGVALRVLPGPRPDWFAPGALDALCAGAYTVAPASNRVALRLDGPPVVRADRGELPSEPLVPGAVQVPPDGRPVVFGADHPVTGGYPVLAVLDVASRDRAAQLRPGDPVRFVLTR